MSADDMFSSTLPDLKGLMKKLDAMNEKQNSAMIKGINKGADVILAEQKRLISAKSKRLENALKKSRVIISKNKVSVASGYQADAFSGENSIGVMGMTYEFGRPGKSRGRDKETMKQTRHGEEVDVKKGLIVPVPHVRRGFDNKVEEAADACIETVEEVLDGEWDK